MRIEYANSKEDYETFLNLEWAQIRARRRSDHYESALWYSGVLLLGGFASYLAEQPFLLALFVVLLGFSWKQNWSFAQMWQRQILASVSENFVEGPNTLTLDPQGLTETFGGVTTAVPWQNVVAYSSFGGCLFIRHVPKRTIILPERSLNGQTKQELLEILKQHGVQEAPPG